ncbi:MAG TPA: DUF72 domain-containing protein [Steroidobacteraceae bacterium]|nr:DUF72 domain-containing protein [Steroidobacteraceae bacterium]
MIQQIDLFGAAASDSGRPVDPATPAGEWRRLAEQLPPGLRFGTSSWSFPGWHGLVYGRRYSESVLARHGLAAYAAPPLLRAVGLDRTYYGTLSAGEFAAYAEVVPADFRFIVKCHAAVTTPPERRRPAEAGSPDRYLDAVYAVERVALPAREGLGDRLGAVLLQFPPLGFDRTGDPAAFVEDLARFLESWPQAVPVAVELRDRELVTPEYIVVLHRAGAVHCLNLHPRMPSVDDQLELLGRVPEPCIVRWMLHPGLSYESARERYRPFTHLVDPDPEQRRSVAALCMTAARQRIPTYVIANNKAEGSAPLTVFELAREILERSPSSDP